MAQWSIRARACALIAAGLLAACGGGGGDGSASGSGTGSGSGIDTGSGSGGGSGSAGLLAFDIANGGRVAGYPLWAGELMFRIGQTVLEEVEVAAGQGAGTVTTVDCESGGSLQRRWTDGDGNGRLGAGDEITLDFSACGRDPLARSAQGRMVVKVDALDATGDFTARVLLPAPGMVLASAAGAPGPWNLLVSGQSRVELARTALRHALSMGGGSADAMTFEFPGADVAGDRITNFVLEKTHHWDEARTHLSLRMHYDCPEIGGSFDVDTPTPLLSWLDEYPEPGSRQGHVAMHGRDGDLITIGPNGEGDDGGDDSNRLHATLDQGGDGVVEARGAGYWAELGLVSGVFFADYTPGGRGLTYGFDPLEFSLRLPFVGGSTLAVDPIFSVQFSRPPSGSKAWRWRLLDRGRLDSFPTEGEEVPVEVERHGALISIRPARALQYSHRYQLLVETGETSEGGQVLRATTGGTMVRHGGSLGEFTTPDYLSTRSSLSGHLTLKAGESVEALAFPPLSGLPEGLAYRWTQLGGTPLTIARPDQASTTMTIAPGAEGIGTATVRLTVSLPGEGNSASGDFVLRTVADLGDPWLARLRVPSDLSNAYKPIRELWSGSGVGSLSAVVRGDRLSLVYEERSDPSNPEVDWSFELASGDGLVLQPGTYANAYSTDWYRRPPGVPTMDLVSGEMRPGIVAGTAVIHELEVDAEGRVTRLALDFDAPQEDGLTPSSSGAIRIHSTRPLPE